MTTPLILVDNVFDTIGLYPSAVLDAGSEAIGREAFRAADYRRDRTWWQATAINQNWLRVDHGAGVTRNIDFLFIDRGHNLWGKEFQIQGGDDGSNWPLTVAFVAPAVGTVGGDPTWPSIAVTEEGALYSVRATSFGARRWWRFVMSLPDFMCVVPGIIAGLKTQLADYSAIYDEDAGERTQIDQTSRAGHRGAAMTYSWRTCELDLRLIGASEYDTTMRDLRRLLFERNQPAVVFMNYVSHPARGWMYQYDGAGWGMPKTRVHRGGRIRLRELGAVLP